MPCPTLSRPAVLIMALVAAHRPVDRRLLPHPTQGRRPRDRGVADHAAVLGQFTAADVPALGPTEPGPTPRKWPEPTGRRLPWPGNGLAQHPMLYAGEGYNTIFLVNDGRVIWTYSSGTGGEIGDVWMMSNGHVLFVTQRDVQEVTPRKEVVWRWRSPRAPRCTARSRSASTRSCWCRTACRPS